MPDLLTLSELQTSAPTIGARPDAALLIAAASRRIERYCGRSFGPGTGIVERLSGRGSATLYLSRDDVSTITAVMVDGDILVNTGGRAWQFEASTGRLVRGDGRCDPRRARPWPRGSGNVVVTYTVTAAVPADIKLVAVALCKAMADALAANGAMKREKIGDYEYESADPAAAVPWPLGVLGVLDTYCGRFLV